MVGRGERMIGSRRFRVIAATIGVPLITAMLGLYAGQQLDSSGTSAAAADPTSYVAVSVVEEVLTSSLVLRGTVVLGDEAELEITGGSDVMSVVTRTPVSAGEVLDNADVLVEISGRPVFVFDGSVPTYRDITIGDEGDDVRQVETGLAEAGYAPGAVDGSADGALFRALRALYTDAGYAPREPSPEEAGAVEQAAAAVRSAEAQVGRRRARAVV